MIVFRDFARRVPAWDASVKVSFALALVLFLCLMALGLGGPAELRLPARIGAFGVLVTGQLLFLWGNRRDVSPYHQAQQRFIAGDYQAAKAILEAAPATARESVDALVLLGNTYRHLAQFDRSRAVLERALALNPRHHLAHFSHGKLSLVHGDYAVARDSIARALKLGAPDIVHFELGQACYLSGDTDAARRAFDGLPADSSDEPGQALLLAWYLRRLGAAAQPEPGLASAGRASILADAAKYAGTSYGDHLSCVLQALERSFAAV
ncbi:MAG: tetratricopeptide repeat protein [Chloroflexi bacterium]|nr:tetratricopeptide repeat protein [Chloroflexota bacterium]